MFFLGGPVSSMDKIRQICQPSQLSGKLQLASAQLDVTFFSSIIMVGTVGTWNHLRKGFFRMLRECSKEGGHHFGRRFGTLWKDDRCFLSLFFCEGIQVSLKK